MSIINIDVESNPDILEKRVFDPVPPGKYVCEVGNDLKIEDSASSDNKIVRIELMILDDGELKGRKIFDNLVIGATPETRKKTEWKIAQFAIACGICTKETLNEINLDAFKGATCEVKISIKTELYKGETKAKNYVKEYIFETEDES